VLSDGPALFTVSGADHLTRSGLTLDGGKRPPVNLESCRPCVVKRKIAASGQPRHPWSLPMAK
jgi:hypothetical protein